MDRGYTPPSPGRAISFRANQAKGVWGQRRRRETGEEAHRPTGVEAYPLAGGDLWAEGEPLHLLLLSLLRHLGLRPHRIVQ
jgi:hypothetical protein